MTEEAVSRQVREARGKFAAMAGTYGLGTFNDSFFRQSAIFVGFAAGRGDMQGWIMAIFTLPYLLFASPAGWLADRFSKRRVVIAAKCLELLAMLCGAVGICTGNWHLILAMVFTMGLQSCIFSPALNGSIPELYPAAYVTRANATLKVAVTASILGGISMSGLAMSRQGSAWGVPMGRLVVAAGAVVISCLGLLGSLRVPRRPPAAPAARFPWTGLLDTLRQLAEIRRDRLLSIVVAADVFVWFAGSLLVLLVNSLAKTQFGAGDDVAGYLVAGEVVGVAAGGLLGSRLARGKRWHRVLPAGALGMVLPLAAMSLVPLLPEALRLMAGFVLLPLAGVMGGMLLVPCEAFVQVRPPADRKGTVIASVNFAVFAGILISGPAAIGLNSIVRPSSGFAAVAGLSLAVGLWLRRALSGEAGP